MAETIRIGEHEVPRIGLGTIHLTVERGFGAARDNAVALLREAASLGVELFDTADSYGNGAAEDAVRQALHPYSGLVIATKGGYRHERLNDWKPDGHPTHLRSAVEGSLRRLGVDAIDLYQLHCPDPKVPYAESIGALVRLQAEGKIRHIGVSNVTERELEAALHEASIVSVQNPYNLRYRKDSGMLEACARRGLAFIPWMPLGDGDIPWSDLALHRVAARRGATPAQVALAALLHLSPVVLPIPGTSSSAHLRENVAAARLMLDAADMGELWGELPR